ncbi:hypothetical protein T492DRAFT_856504 [Pavlovales sp. CCMP2436]|nr:hypothetical protein T492DRAFT_856504 [Pavlovales sp. CCMP2436]
MTAADKAGVELFVPMRAPRGRYPGACGEAAAGDGWEARLGAIWGWLATVLPSDVDFKIAPWFARGGRVMFVLTACVAIAPLLQRAAGGKSHGGAAGGKSHGGRASRARRAAERAAKRAAKRAAERAAAPAPAGAPADARIEELMVPSPVADAATGVVAAPAAATPADAPAAEVARLSQTSQVSPPSLPLLALFHAPPAFDFLHSLPSPSLELLRLLLPPYRRSIGTRGGAQASAAD